MARTHRELPAHLVQALLVGDSQGCCLHLRNDTLHPGGRGVHLQRDRTGATGLHAAGARVTDLVPLADGVRASETEVGGEPAVFVVATLIVGLRRRSATPRTGIRPLLRFESEDGPECSTSERL